MTRLAVLSLAPQLVAHSILTAGRHRLPGLPLTGFVTVLQLETTHQGGGVHDKVCHETGWSALQPSVH